MLPRHIHQRFQWSSEKVTWTMVDWNRVVRAVEESLISMVLMALSTTDTPLVEKKDFFQRDAGRRWICCDMKGFV